MEAPDEQQQQQQCLLKQNNNYLLSPATTPATITECVRVHACRVPSKIRQSNSKTAPAAPMRRAATALGSKQWTATTSGSRYESLVHFGKVPAPLHPVSGFGTWSVSCVEFWRIFTLPEPNRFTIPTVAVRLFRDIFRATRAGVKWLLLGNVSAGGLRVSGCCVSV